MHAVRKLLATSAAAIVAMASGVLVAHAETTPSVYNTPGGQISAGRLWDTTCEKYSSDVVRCTAKIWSTQVRYVRGRYVSTTGWAFNNLTYLPAPRTSWKGNNLARSNPQWNSGGRLWKTECDTATTGRGGCRSYVWTKKVIAVKSGSGYTYKNNQQWVFNNLVLFSSAAVPAVKTVPPWIIDQSRLSLTGLGPLQVGTPTKLLKTLGYLVYPDKYCDFGYGESEALDNRGIELFVGNSASVVEVRVSKKGVRTVDGAQVGMTYAAVKAIYGDRMTKKTMDDVPGDSLVPTAVVRSANRELVFLIDKGASSIKDNDVIRMIMARGISDELYFDGC